MSDDRTGHNDQRGPRARLPTATESTGGAADRSLMPGGPEREPRNPLGAHRDTNTPISLAAHAALDPFAAILFIVAPLVFGFHGVSQAKNVSIVIGIATLLTAMMTCWRMAIIKVIPLAVHRSIDLILAAAAIASPYLFGFSGDGSAAHFLLIIGIVQLDIAILTRWDPANDFAAAKCPAEGARRAD